MMGSWINCKQDKPLAHNILFTFSTYTVIIDTNCLAGVSDHLTLCPAWPSLPGPPLAPGTP